MCTHAVKREKVSKASVCERKREKSKGRSNDNELSIQQLSQQYHRGAATAVSVSAFDSYCHSFTYRLHQFNVDR